MHQPLLYGEEAAIAIPERAYTNYTRQEREAVNHFPHRPPRDAYQSSNFHDATITGGLFMSNLE